jgi:outer membrane protein OmpA-like peptidoglycan-associated protein/Tol biopolymer transport system component
MKKIILFFVLGITTHSVHSQSNKTLYREKFVEGNYLMLEENYPLALRSFQEAYQIDSSSANINYKLGLCYLQSPEKEKAVYHLERAVKNVTHNYSPENPLEKRASDQAFYYLAEAYRLNYNFIASYVNFQKFKEQVGDRNPSLTAELDKELQKNTNAQEFTKDTARVRVVNLGDSINSPFPDYAPVISADESTLIFTSRRPGSTGGEKSDDGLYMEDIYLSTKRRNGSWGEATQIASTINTSGNEANIGLSPDGSLLFVYKDVNGGDIYYSRLEGEIWSPLLPIGASVNSPDWETHATMSVDGNTLYFVSNRKEGGFGGRDIWSCEKLPNGEWSKATNMGPTINTKEDEEAPFIHPDGVTMFFSSKGHKNMGGFDVFKTTRGADGKWSEPENLRAPINTPDHDIFFVQSADGKRAYLSSNRKGGIGDKDIYRIDFERSVCEPLTLLKGLLRFNGENKHPANARITVMDENGLVLQDIRPNEKTGKYVMILAPGVKGKTYKVNFEAQEYQPVSISLVIAPNSAYQEIERNFTLQMVNDDTKTPGTMGVKGVVRNKNGKAIPGAEIVVKDNLTGNLLETIYTTIDSGAYYFVVNRGQNYNISYEAKGYLFHSENINVPKLAEYSLLQKDVVLDKVEVGSKIVLNNIFFDSNKSILRKESGVEIDKLVALMKEYPELVIEVSGHTDNKGNDAANMTLSQARSQSVVTALLKKGVPKEKLIAKGYGETAPVAPNTLPNGKPDLKGMQLNRRVEMKIIK